MGSASAKGKNNSLTENWSEIYGGVPNFDQVKVEDFSKALDLSIKDYKKDIRLIAEQKQSATFENTIVALENAGKLSKSVFPVFAVWAENLSTKEFQRIETKFAPKLSALNDEITQNSKLFKRIEKVYLAKDKLKLTSEQNRLIKIHYEKFVHDGAKLTPAKKLKIAKINEKLATKYNKFSQNLLNDEENRFVLLSLKKDLEGLPLPIIDGYAAEAKRRGIKSKWVVANTRSAAEPFLSSSSRRDLREKVFKMWSSRGDMGSKTDNNKLIAEIVKLRAEKAKILGFSSYAHWSLSLTMAKTPTAALDLMLKVWKPAVERVQEEVADMQEIVDKEKGDFRIAPWDYRYYAEKVRKKKFDLNQEALRPYLQLKNIQRAMFWTAEKLFQLKFTQVSDVPVFHPDVTVFKVTDLKDKYVGLWYFDPFAREGKHSGAWMASYRDQERTSGIDVYPLVSNNSNFIPGKKGEEVFISWDDANTMFHEFGHALHGLNSNVTYASLSGTNVPLDFVELPSQILENFLFTKKVLNFLVDKNGKRIPGSLMAKMEKAKTFNQGFQTVEFLSSALVDMKLHLAASQRAIDPRKFETQVLEEIGMPSEIVMRHRLPQFGHLFSGEGYAAGYYAYLWAQVLEKDAFEAFLESKIEFDIKIAKKLKEFIFASGNSVEPELSYRNFRGRDAKVDALLRSRGFL